MSLAAFNTKHEPCKCAQCVLGTANSANRMLAVLKLTAQGHTSREIAKELFISPASVKRDKRKLFDYLGVRNMAEAVAIAAKEGLI